MSADIVYRIDENDNIYLLFIMRNGTLDALPKGLLEMHAVTLHRKEYSHDDKTLSLIRIANPVDIENCRWIKYRDFMQQPDVVAHHLKHVMLKSLLPILIAEERFNFM